MQFTHAQHAASNTTTKIALVVVFHVLLGIALVKTMNVRLLAPPALPTPVTLVPTVIPPVIEPPVALPTPRMAPPQIVVPAVAVPAPTPPATVTTTTTITEAPPPAQATGTASTPADPGVAQAPPAAMRTAAMADGCARPAYPAQAARNGDAGTVTVALLVGVDGRVSSARIDRSSGFRDLDRAALAALSLCRFKPALHGDVPEAGWTVIAYQWTLE